ncbi:MAG: UDP-N-acetylmuramate--L-alanine ligase [Sulfobacillus acidophilus]|uniref:UDP-N-acetylmuramate--L-alanine ligase n=1 Tax=Sulfobacillus acidophilus TaxID=53633 RepID=A0A2T2WE01_9FIRM|nr:MAG: UDP-N-acetylmuramate--L-alanine ligase [Sulfobacillus acidophilus]
MKRIHFIGIGGYSMSGLALWLHRQGYAVTGSDMNPSSRTDRLLRDGILVWFGHAADHVQGADEVIFNTDVHEDNVEWQAAQAAGLPLRHRSDVLAEILNTKRAITVSGTHGKTTTTTMIGTVLSGAGFDPSILVGGEVETFGGNVRVGQSEWIVAEADESDGTFLRYHPEIAVATNIEPEHLEHFNESFDALIGAFRRYLSAVPPNGIAVLGVDDPVLAAMAQDLPVPVRTYGLSDRAEVRGVILGQNREGTLFDAYEGFLRLGSVHLKVPGVHNVKNALATLAVARHLGIDHASVFAALSEFRNANRRFQVLARGPILVVDDYAHHPTEIRATLEACRQVTNGRVIVLFQPQRYVRTHNLWHQFIEAFDAADIVVLTEIYAPPGELPIAGVSGSLLAQAIGQHRHAPIYYVPDMFDAVDLVMPLLMPGDTFITMGAGPVHKVGERVSQLLA